MISLSSPVKTKAHGWPAGAKLAGLCILSILLIAITSPLIHALFFSVVLFLYLLAGRIFFVSGIKKLFILWPFILIVSLWHLYNGQTAQGITIVLRLLSAVALANLVTMTTKLSDMIDVIHRLAKPLTFIGLKTQALEISIALVIRLTPELIAKGTALSQAWRARSPKRPNWKVVIPFIVVTLDDADHSAEALRARGGIQPTHKE